MKGILVAALIGLITANAQALDPTRAVSQYAHSAWRLQDGYLSGIPSSIAQTSDGYLWIGTLGGLFRFDGVRFVPWTAPEGQKLPSDNIISLAPSRDGGLWIGTASGLARWTGHELISFAPAGRIDRVIVDLQGNAWVVRARTHDSLGPLCEAVGFVLQCHGAADGIPSNYAGVLAQDAAGNFWIGVTDKLVRWRPGSSTTYPIQGLKAETGLSGVQDIVAAPDNSLWVGMDRSGRSLGLQRFAEGRWDPLVTPTFNSSTLEVGALFLDRNGDLWIGTMSKGIYRIHDRQVDHFDSSNGLSGDTIYGFLEDREGNIWVATSSGIDSFRDLPVATFSTHQGLSSDQAHSILATRDGTVWIGTIGSLDFIRAGRVSSIRAHQGLPGQEVTAMLEDNKGQLWVGVDNALYRYGNSRFTPVPGFEGKSAGLVYSMAESGDHSVWGASFVSERPQFVQFVDGKAKQKFEPPKMPIVHRVEGDHGDRLWVSVLGQGLTQYREGTLDSDLLRKTGTLPKLNNFFVDTDGSTWMGTSGGLAVWTQGTLRLLAARNGLPCDTIYSLIRDAHQALWLYSHCGLVRIEKSEIDRWWANPKHTVQSLTLDVFSGAQPAPAPFTPAATRSPDGRLWFANDSVAQMVDPDHLDLNPMPPPVHIEQVLAQGQSYSAQKQPRLPPHTRDIQIDYTALSFVSPQRVLFRVMLEGHDSQWSDVGARRSAFYTNLSPGMYRFLVTACNNSGVWNSQGAALSFTILPAWYQTIWFRLFALLALALLCYALYWQRMRQYVAGMRALFNERLDERTQIARNLHDTLLQTIQGSKMVADQARSDLSDPGKTEKYLNRLSEWLDRASLEGRAALESLRVANSGVVDLAESIQRGIEEWQTKCEIAILFKVKGVPCKIHPVVRQEIFMIAYEAIGNACRHSGGQTVAVQLSYESGVGLSVSDDGNGIDEQTLKSGRAGRFGLTGMRERAQRIHATLNILSTPCKGTKVALIVPGKMIFESSLRPGDSLFRKLKSPNRRSHPQHVQPIEDESEAWLGDSTTDRK